MRILIAGGGEVATLLARRLVHEGNQIVIVEENAERCAHLESILDAKVVHGSAASVKVLHAAGLGETDMLIAVTNADEINLLCCLIAQAESKVRLKVARLRTHEVDHWRRICKEGGLNIDLIIHPESEAVARMLPVVRTPGVSDILEFADGRVRLFGMYIEANSRLSGKALAELDQEGPPPDSLIAMIFRGQQVIIPHGSEKLLPDDHIYVVCTRENFEAVLHFMGLVEQPRLERAFILGGKQIGIQLAEQLEKRRVQVKLFERDARRCEKISEILKDTVVVHGDGKDAATLVEENIRGVGAYFALTHDDEDNLIASMLARRLGARKVVALINRLNYLQLGQKLGIHSSISPRLATVDRILQFVRKGLVVSVTTFGEEEAEAIEMVASPGSRFVNKKLMDLRFPRGVIVGAIARPDGEVLIPRGKSVIRAGDRVIFFTLESNVAELEKAFLSDGSRK